MDYYELIIQWENGNRELVANEVLKMKCSEVLAFAFVFIKKFDEVEFGTLEVMVMKQKP